MTPRILKLLMLAGSGAAMVGLAILWIGACVFVYMDATRRNLRSATLWAFGTLVTGPVGLIAYLIDRPSAPLVDCPRCGRPVLSTDELCPYCGRSLS